MTLLNKVIKINEFPQPLPERNELEQIRWEFPFGQALSQNSLKGALRFVYTECETFIQAIEPRYRIIMGRKGSGKTALIKRICLGNEYDVKVICKKEELFKWVDTAIERDSVEEELIEPYFDRCIDFFWISIFQSLVKSKDLKNIKEYLSHSNLNEGTILGGIQEWSSVNLDAKNPFASLSAGVVNTFIKRNKIDFNKAKLEAIEFLKDKKVVVLIDNLENYPFNTLRQKNIFAALLLSAVQFSDNANITVKCFIPSEVSIKLKDNAFNWGKLNQYMIELRWKDKELLTMLCRRLRFYLYRERKDICPDLSEFQEVNKALQFWKLYFVERVYNSAFEVDEPIVPYILRHTQLTPRQAIQLCNKIVEKDNNFPDIPVSSNSVKEGIKNWEKNLCEEVFSSFRETYPNAEEFCSQHLRKLPMSFRSSTLLSEVYDNLDSNNSDYQIYKNNYMLVERMLFDLGILGMGINSNNQKSKIYDTYNITEFEPNCDDNLSPNQNNDIFVHPMFIHKINFIRDLGACSKPVCPVKAVETLELFE